MLRHRLCASRLASLLVVLALAAALSACRSSHPAASEVPAAETSAASETSDAVWQALPEHPAALRAFLTRFPKGADLHTHLTGAVYAETYLEIARRRGLCYRPDPFALVACDAAPDARPPDPYGGLRPAPPSPDSMRRLHSVERLFENQTLYDNAVDALSMRNHRRDDLPGLEQFFSTFARFDAADPTDPDAAAVQYGTYVAELVTRAARQNLTYVEPQLMRRGPETARRAQAVPAPLDGWRASLSAFVDSLDAHGFDAHADAVARDFDRMDRAADDVLGCAEAPDAPACRLQRRYQYHAIRVLDPRAVFGQLLTGFRVAERSDVVVAVNLVAPENHRVALRDYDLHMRMIEFLRTRYPDVNVSLHAGELTLGLVPPEHLRDHVRHAVDIAGAQRIGHGVDLFYEDDPWALVDTLKARDTLVEVCLTSNDVILNLTGEDHPFPLLLRAGVPLALATDDEGVSRIDLTHEFQRAVETYGLTTADLVTLARNSVHYAFLPGDPLWLDAPTYSRVAPACADDTLGGEARSDACQAFLDANPNAAASWDLERRLRAFRR